MTEQPKYYVPEISEFHVGFEYEYLNEYAKPVPTWQKETLQFNDWFVHNFEIEKARVKHLDTQDIESLGWKLDVLDGSEYLFEARHQTFVLKHHKQNEWHIRTTDNSRGFNFEIKNTPELRTIMKQIGITK